MNYYNKKKSFTPNGKNTISECSEFIEKTLTDLGINKKLIMRSCLAAEELLVELLAFNVGSGEVVVRIQKILGKTSISITVPGPEYDPYWKDLAVGIEDLDAQDEAQNERSIRGILLASFCNNIKLDHKHGKNRGRIIVSNEEQSLLKLTIAGLFLGIIFGLLLKYAVPEAGTTVIRTYILTPIKTMFMSALNIVIAPVVFFSIVSCISQFKDLSELGKIGAKVFGMYCMTTLIAVTIATISSLILSPGEPGFALTLALDSTGSIARPDQVDTSLLSTIVGIVPNNIVRPFLEANTLQIIFLAAVLGIAVGQTGEHSTLLSNFFEGCNALFLTLTTMIAKFIPLAVFCSVSMLIINMNADTLFALLGVVGTILLTLAVMISIYGLLILLVANLNPLTFYKKAKEGMLTSFTLSSSSAAMPVNLKVCTNYLGISPKVCNFSIPFGATVNMDGTSITLTIFGLFLARAFAVDVPTSMLVSLAITIMLLSLGAPGVPGSGLVCLGVVLAQLGVPFEAIGLVIGIYPFIDMFSTMNNTTGDVAISLIVAKTENLLDVETYNK